MALWSEVGKFNHWQSYKITYLHSYRATYELAPSPPEGIPISLPCTAVVISLQHAGEPVIL